LYTSGQWGRPAASGDFQRAFDAVNTGNRGAGKKDDAAGRRNKPKNSPKTLDKLFDQWVYGISDTKSR
jgi:hypothetical protein